MISNTDAYLKSANSLFEEISKLTPKGARNINLSIKYVEQNVRGIGLSFQFKNFLTKNGEEIFDIENIFSEGKKLFIEKNSEKIEIVEKKETIILKPVPISVASYYAFDIFIQCLKKDDNNYKISEILDYQNEIFKNSTNNYRVALIIKKKIKKDKEGKEIIEIDENEDEIIIKYFQLVLYNYDSADPLKYYNFINDYLFKSQGFLYEDTLIFNNMFFQELDEIINPPSQEDVILNNEKDFEKKPAISDPSSWAGKLKNNIIAASLSEPPKSPSEVPNSPSWADKLKEKIIEPSVLKVRNAPNLELSIKEVIDPPSGILGNVSEQKQFSELFISNIKNKKMQPSVKQNNITPSVLKILTKNENLEMKENIKEKNPEPVEIKQNVFSLVSKITFDSQYFPVSIIGGKPTIIKQKSEKEMKLEKMISDHKKNFNIPDDQDIPKDVLNLLTEINKLSTKDIPEIDEIEIKDTDDLVKFMKISVNGKPTFKCHFDEEEGEYFYIFQGKVINLKDCGLV